MDEKEICNECGRSVAFGSGWYVNRVPDLDTIEERIEAGKPFPEGGWLCAECEARIYDCAGIYDCANPLPNKAKAEDIMLETSLERWRAGRRLKK